MIDKSMKYHGTIVVLTLICLFITCKFTFAQFQSPKTFEIDGALHRGVMIDSNSDGIEDTMYVDNLLLSTGEKTFDVKLITTVDRTLSNQELLDSVFNYSVQTSPVSYANFPSSSDALGTADFNSDGIDDLASWIVTNTMEVNYVFYNTNHCGGGVENGKKDGDAPGSPDCKPSTNIYSGIIPTSYAVLISLIDNNGLIYDQIISNDIPLQLSTVTWYDRTEGTPIHHPTQIDLIVNDFNNDGNVDIITWARDPEEYDSFSRPSEDIANANEMFFFNGQGNGDLDFPVSIGTKMNVDLRVCDYDNDNLLDIGWFHQKPESDLVYKIMFNNNTSTDSPIIEEDPQTPTTPPTTAPEESGNIEFKGTVSEVGPGYFVVNDIQVNYVNSVVKYEDGVRSIEVGTVVEGKGNRNTDGTVDATKVEVRGQATNTPPANEQPTVTPTPAPETSPTPAPSEPPTRDIRSRLQELIEKIRELYNP